MNQQVSEVVPVRILGWPQLFHNGPGTARRDSHSSGRQCRRVALPDMAPLWGFCMMVLQF